MKVIMYFETAFLETWHVNVPVCTLDQLKIDVIVSTKRSRHLTLISYRARIPPIPIPALVSMLSIYESICQPVLIPDSV